MIRFSSQIQNHLEATKLWAQKKVQITTEKRRTNQREKSAHNRTKSENWRPALKRVRGARCCMLHLNSFCTLFTFYHSHWDTQHVWCKIPFSPAPACTIAIVVYVTKAKPAPLNFDYKENTRDENREKRVLREECSFSLKCFVAVQAESIKLKWDWTLNKSNAFQSFQSLYRFFRCHFIHPMHTRAYPNIDTLFDGELMVCSSGVFCIVFSLIHSLTKQI